jgi:5-methylcytosine-specific restriction protein A
MAAVRGRREDLHGEYGSQRQGGISAPFGRDLTFLFTSGAGSEFGYKDEFRPDGTFRYTGEGQEGDVEMTRELPFACFA